MYVPEIDVIIATVKWLHREGYNMQAISIPRGQGLSVEEQKKKLSIELDSLNSKYTNEIFKPHGPDIIAKSADVMWNIECKGLGTGTGQTLRNNFDRALSSTVSYYDGTDGLRLGLSMVDCYHYYYLVRDRIPQALRKALNMWVFLYAAEDDEIRVFEPLQTI